MKKTLKYLEGNFEEMLLVSFLVVISCALMLQVIMRYVFNASLSWPEELARYCFVYSGFLGIGYCIRRNKTLRVDLILAFLPKPVVTVLDYIGAAVAIAFYSTVFYASLQTVLTNTMKSTAMKLPLKYVYLAVTIGFGLGVLRQIQAVVISVIRRRAQKEEAE